MVTLTATLTTIVVVVGNSGFANAALSAVANVVAGRVTDRITNEIK